MIHFLARPHVLSWLFALAWFWVLDSTEKDCLEARPGSAAARGNLLWILPLTMLIWVNVHGGFLVGFVLLAIYWVSAVWCALRLREDKFDEFLARMHWWARARTLAAVGFAAVVGSLANPYGWNLHRHIYSYLSNRFLMEHIDEFQSPNFHGVAQKCFAILALVAMAALGTRVRRVRVSEGLVVLFALYLGCYASRNIPVSSLLLALVTGPLLSEEMGKLGESTAPIRWSRGVSGLLAGLSRRMGRMESALRGNVWPIAVVVFTGWIAAQGGTLGGGSAGALQLMNAHFDEKRFPAAAVDFLRRRAAEEPTERDAVLAPDSWGGYLIYRLYPRMLVVVDDRHDFYGEEFLKSYLKLIHLEPGWSGFLEEHDVHCVLVPKGSALANMLALSPPWKSVYVDESVLIFERPKAH